jgi:hypothetical protein
MTKKITIICFCSVVIFVVALFTVTQLMADEIKPPQIIRKYQARDSSNEIIVAGIKKRYTRNDRGCVETVEFYNDPANCAGYESCPNDQKPGWVPAIEFKNWPKIWGEDLVGAGSTKGVVGSDECVEWRFTVAGSPGWDCDYIGGRLVCSCIGYYYQPRDWCCDPRGCKARP